MRVLIAAGGTGGHLFPGVALAREFERQAPGSETKFVGTARGLETKVVPREGFELLTITAQGVMGKGWGKALAGLAVVPVGVAQCLAMCRQQRPDLAIGIGGYTSPPLILAAWLLGIKRAILEPNVQPGMANRVLAPVANLVFVSFAETARQLGSHARVVGTPIRREFFTRTAAEESRTPTLLVLGGSQGARSINRAMVSALPLLLAAQPSLRVIHQTGERDYEEVAEAYRKCMAGRQVGAGGASGTRSAGVGPPPDQMEVVSFLYDVPRAFRQADLIVSRSGAMTVAEVTASGKPALFIPFPHAAQGHQEHNARVLERAGAAQVIVDARLSGELLAETISALLANPERLRDMGRKSKALGQADAAEQIVKACREMVEDVR